MKKLILISVCILSLTFAGSAATSSSRMSKATVKKEAPAAKKGLRKPHAKKVAIKKETVTPVNK